MDNTAPRILMANHTEYSIDQLEVHDENILRIVDDNSVGSIEYRIVQLPDVDGDEDNGHMIISDDSGASSAGHAGPNESPQYFVISEANLSDVYVSNDLSAGSTVIHQPPSRVQHHQHSQKMQRTSSVQPVAIAPKIAAKTNGNNSAAKACTPAGAANGKAKKRDERRRVTHNEVERRRRDKINHWIEKLGSIIPVDGQPGGSLLLDRPTMFNRAEKTCAAAAAAAAAGGDGQSSKGGILSKACEYVTALHRKVNTLNECLKESEKINIESQRLRDSNARLAVENELLRERLAKLGISPPCIVLSPSSSSPASMVPKF